MRFCRLAAGLLLATVATFSTAADLRTLSDKLVTGELVSIDDKSITLKTAEGPVAVPILTGVLDLNLQALPAVKDMPFCHQVELTDGTLVHVKPEEGFVIKDSKVTLTLLNDQKVELPLTALSYVLKNANDPKIRDNLDWKRCLKERATKDVLAIWDKDHVRINNPDGTFAEKGEGTILGFTSSTGTVLDKNDLNNKRTQGWIFVNKPDPGAAICRLLDMHHNSLAVAKLTVKEGGNFQVTTVSGIKLDYPQAQVAKLDFRKGRLEFISDMEPKIVAEPTEDRERYRYYADADKRNKNLDGHGLQLGGQKYPKGLSLPAPTTLQYALDGEYKEFSATIGVDETVSGGSHAKLVIRADGRELFSADVKRKDAPRTIRLGIRDAKTLTIEVAPAGVLPWGHRIDLGDAKVNK
jgi:hypothetical protein